MPETPVLDRVLFSQEQLAARVEELGRQISADYRGKTPLFVGILRGSILFYADLMKQISIDCNMDFMCLSSYSGTSSTGQVRTMLDLRESIKNRHVVVVEDIVDTGLTIHQLREHMRGLGATSVRVASMLFKPTKLEYADAKPDYIGHEISEEFVIGYGLDFDGFVRNLDAIYKVTEH